MPNTICKDFFCRIAQDRLVALPIYTGSHYFGYVHSDYCLTF